jgi:hypothetical protein
MKKYKFIILIFSILILAIFLSCDDSGVIHGLGVKGTIYLQTFNLPHLNGTIDGYYELWIRIDSNGICKYYSCGKFNIGYDGSVTDTAGGQMTFKFMGDTNKLYGATNALITVEPYGTNNISPGSLRLLSCPLSSDPYKDSLYGTLTVSDPGAMGLQGDKIKQCWNTYFTLMTPTGTNSTCLRGLWFCNPDGSTTLPPGLTLPSSYPWIYEGWLADTSNPSNQIYYSMGRFYDPYHADLDSAGLCRGPNPGIDKPGQDWVEDNCISGKPNITDLHNGHYQVSITLEPANELPGSVTYNSPFPIRIYWGPLMPAGCNLQEAILSLWYLHAPKAHLRISN